MTLIKRSLGKRRCRLATGIRLPPARQPAVSPVWGQGTCGTSTWRGGHNTQQREDPGVLRPSGQDAGGRWGFGGRRRRLDPAGARLVARIPGYRPAALPREAPGPVRSSLQPIKAPTAKAGSHFVPPQPRLRWGDGTRHTGVPVGRTPVTVGCRQPCPRVHPRPGMGDPCAVSG